MKKKTSLSTKNSDNERTFDIHERIYKWVLNIVNLTKKMPKSPQNFTIINQLVSSATSVGANDQEADASFSKKDFTAKYVIARKECKESIYWLRLFKDTNPSRFHKEVDRYIIEGNEIFRIICTIINNANKTKS